MAQISASVRTWSLLACLMESLRSYSWQKERKNGAFTSISVNDVESKDDQEVPSF